MNDHDTTPEVTPELQARWQQEQQAAQAMLHDWLSGPPELRVIAIATTGLKGTPIEVAILDNTGSVLLRQYIHAQMGIEMGAQGVHGLSAGWLEENGLPFGEAWPEVLRCLAGHTVVGYNGKFITEAINRGITTWNGGATPEQHIPWPTPPIKVEAAQDALTPICGAWNWGKDNWSYVGLPECLQAADISTQHMAPAGSALGNAQRLYAVIGWYAAAPLHGMSDAELDALLEMELEAQEQAAAPAHAQPRRRPLSEQEQEERWRQDDLMERRAAFMREDY